MELGSSSDSSVHASSCCSNNPTLAWAHVVSNREDQIDSSSDAGEGCRGAYVVIRGAIPRLIAE